ncbi:NADH-ubiquinone oxidoreductase assembly factor N7BML [Cyberlindnera fabianii]|uniref:NADH-ubiquinone oxidoreductase assembly factor N7BML n=1 Tax=Cyberlindnera fabianii TaxID=36022 RepID=A0A1V2L1W4_CYBFA|nr:NADH-ubiquinone oxidoreductase assembly factor N7BML [Cyberlindnera fabianii]
MDPLQGKITPLRRLWLQWKSLRKVPFRRQWFVGYDLEGNMYWEFKVESHGRLRRRVEYLDKRETLAEYSMKKVHPRWSSWLTFTRPDPPSLTELIADLQRQEVMKILAERADERWRNESVLTDNNRILHDKIIAARTITERGSKETSNKAETKEAQKLDPPQRFTQQASHESPIESATVESRR